MNKLLNFVETKLAPPLNKMASQHHLSAVKNGMIVTVPLTIIGSIFLLIPNIPIAAIKNFFEPLCEYDHHCEHSDLSVVLV